MLDKLTSNQVDHLFNAIFDGTQIQSMVRITQSVYRFSNAFWLYAKSNAKDSSYPDPQKERNIFVNHFIRLTFDALEAMRSYLDGKSDEEITDIFSSVKNDSFQTEEEFEEFINSLFCLGNVEENIVHIYYVAASGLLRVFNGKEFNEIFHVLFGI